MSRRLLPLLTVGLLLGVACGSGGSGGSGGGGGQQTGAGFTATELCALVTQAEVSAATGAAMGAGVPSGVNSPSCTWQAGDATGATIAASSPDAVGKIPFGLQGKEGAHVTAVPGVGDKAFFAAGGGDFPNAELDIAKGSRAVTITVGFPGGNATQAQQEAAELAIGKAAVARM